MHVSLRAKLVVLLGMLVASDAYGLMGGGGRLGGRGGEGGAAAGERLRNGARLLEGDASSVVQEAFDENGASLGFSHEAASNWSLSQVILSEGITAAGDAPYMYHANASY